MSAFVFTNYRLRATEESDREHCARWIEQDDDHRGRVLPDFFLRPETGVESLALVDDRTDEVMFYFRMTRALRLDIQFGPTATAEEREHLMEALLDGFGWLKETARQSGHRQIIFESKVAPLVRFCNKRFGFKKSANELVCHLSAPALMQPLKQSVPQEQQ